MLYRVLYSFIWIEFAHLAQTHANESIVIDLNEILHHFDGSEEKTLEQNKTYTLMNSLVCICILSECLKYLK